MIAVTFGSGFASVRSPMAAALVAVALAMPALDVQSADWLRGPVAMAASKPPALPGGATGIEPVQGRPTEPREPGRAGGCWARGVWYPEGTESTHQAVFGVQTLSPVPVRVVCRRGTWVTIPG
jgi:hypothetical protein